MSNAALVNLATCTCRTCGSVEVIRITKNIFCAEPGCTANARLSGKYCGRHASMEVCPECGFKMPEHGFKQS